MRAERKCGELLKEMKENGQRHNEKGSNKVSRVATPALKDLGVTRDQASKWQQLAAIPEKILHSLWLRYGVIAGPNRGTGVAFRARVP